MTPRRWLALDLALVVVVAVAAYLVSHRALTAEFRVAYGIEDMLVQCTGKPGWIPDPTPLFALPEWQAFVERKLEVFPCSAIAGIPVLQIGLVWEAQEYFHRALAAWTTLTGPTIEGLLTFQAISYAVTSVLAFLIFRLGLGRIVALAGAAAVIWSPSHLGVVDLPIEYSKAPWILGVVLLCGVIVKRDGAGKSLSWAALGLGLVAGLGIGFKADVMAVVPLALVTPILFVRGETARGWMRKAVATGLVVAGLAAGGGFILHRNYVSPHGSLLPVQVLGGQDWETEAFRASSPLYDYGITFHDSYVTWQINSYGQRVRGTTEITGFFSRQMQDTATAMVIDLWQQFPGDLVLRVLSALVTVVELNGQHLIVAVAGLFLIFVSSRRQGWLAAFVILYLCAYVSLIFQRRHFFHLEFISWLLAGVVAQAALSAAAALVIAFRERRVAAAGRAAIGQLTPAAGAAALCVALIVTTGVTGLWLTRQYQQMGMLRLVEHYLAMPRDAHEVTVQPEADGRAKLRVHGLSLQDRQAAPDASPSDYLMVTIRCATAGIVPIRSQFLPPVAAWSNWNREFKLTCAAAGTESMLLVPIYQYGAGYVFDGLVLNAADAATVVAVSTMRADASVRQWLELLVPGDWRSREWFKRMKDPLVAPL